MPSGSVPGGAGRVLLLVLRHAEQHQPADARLDRLRGGLAQGVPGVLDHARHRADRLRLADALLDEQRQDQVGRVQPGLARPAGAAPGVRRSRRGRTTRESALIELLLTSRAWSARLAAGSRGGARWAGSPARRPPRRVPPGRAELGQRLRQPCTDGSGPCTSTRRPYSSAVFAVGGPMHGDHRDGVRLARDPTRLRTVEDEVNSTASKPPPLIASRIVGGRRRGPHGPVRGDVVDLPAQLDQPGDQRLGGDVGARQQHPVDRVEDLVVGRPVLQQARGGLLAARHQVGLDAEARQRRRRSARRPRRP